MENEQKRLLDIFSKVKYLLPVNVIEKPDQAVNIEKKKYVLEIIYWGLRNLNATKFTNIGFSNFSLEIEIGKEKLEPNLIEKDSYNENFIIKHYKREIELAREDEYKPHLSIRCECNTLVHFYYSTNLDFDLMRKMFGKKFLVGVHTVSSVSEFFQTNDQLMRYLEKTGNNF